MPDLTILIPAHNEESNLAQLINEIVMVVGQRAPSLAYEIVVVDDGSTDGTRAEILPLMQNNAGLRIIVHGRRAGKSAALKTGFEAAEGKWIATLDGDGQNDPADLAALWSEIAAGPDQAIYAGVRRRRNDGLVKKLTSRSANLIRRWALKDTARDAGCGFKVLPAALARELPYFDNMHRFLPALARRHGYAVREIPVNDRARVHGQSKYGLFDRAIVSVLDLIGVYWLIRRYSDRGVVAEEARGSSRETAGPARSYGLRA
ncbi:MULTISPECIES: glycosyltransferase family 2 protein [Rhodomicrobium]|uniref:glycosyltransferase family 2 protein n=1 Tax=Rhodomicrobium TaxID=1068 RepID=UPI000B4B169E|nr:MULTISPECIES: glycosyltransferase family 2 protein [Rhodomicrobium]